MAQVFGRAYITVYGQRLRSMAGAKLDLGGYVREEVLGGSTVLGYSEKVKAASLECAIALVRGDAIEDLRNLTSENILFECDSGQIYVIRNAFLADTLSLTEGGGGNVQLRFVGDPADVDKPKKPKPAEIIADAFDGKLA